MKSWFSGCQLTGICSAVICRKRRTCSDLYGYEDMIRFIVWRGQCFIFSPSSILRASAAACAAPPSLSIKQRLFQSLAEPLEAAAAPLDITHTPTAQELLAHKVLRSLEEEKTESKRYSCNSAAYDVIALRSCAYSGRHWKIFDKWTYHKQMKSFRLWFNC